MTWSALAVRFAHVKLWLFTLLLCKCAVAESSLFAPAQTATRRFEKSPHGSACHVGSDLQEPGTALNLCPRRRPTLRISVRRHCGRGDKVLPVTTLRRVV